MNTIMLSAFSLVLILSIKFAESNRLKQVIFTENGLKGVAVLKGSFNGSPIEGTVNFSQEVIQLDLIYTFLSMKDLLVRFIYKQIKRA